MRAQRLRRSRLEAAGYTRRRSGRGFRYLTAANTAVPREEVERIKDLVIPPAWTDVWISPHANGHIQAVGTDAAGRRQYLYHPRWREARDIEKFRRAAALGRRMPTVRRVATRDLRHGENGRVRALAAAVRLLDNGSLRVGSEDYARANGSYGLSTLKCRHASVRRDVVHLDFPGKSGHHWEISIQDPLLARFLRPLLRRDGDDPLLAYDNGERWVGLDAESINDYISQVAGEEFTAKDFRTWKGTMAAARELARVQGPPTQKAVTAAIKAVAEQLGNTPAVARNSYVDPRLLAAYEKGKLAGIKTNDRTIAALLGAH